jgi:hypothetical protein
VRQSLEPILDLLDEGLRLYRRAFAPLLILAALLAVPIGLALAAFLLAGGWLGAGVTSFVFVGLTFTVLPLSLYVMGALSRAALMVADGEPVRLRRALAIRPARVVGMGCYGTVFSFAASVAVSAVSTACLCGAYLVAVAVIGVAVGVGSAGGAAGGAAAGFLVGVGVVAFLVIYAASLVLNGAIYGSVVYVLQPLAHERGGVGQAIGRSLDLLTFRLGQNLLVFLCTSLVFGAVALAATVAIGVLVPLPALFLLGAESVVARAITAAAWVCGICAAVPLIPIWMALLYRRRAAARAGDDLEALLEGVRAPAAEARGA